MNVGVTDSARYYNPRMATGKRKREGQPAMWVPTTDLPLEMSHPFCARD